MKENTANVARTFESKTSEHAAADRRGTVFDTKPYLSNYKEVGEKKEEYIAP
jgi:hypothetical protein